ncbi:MAG TPA: hypothetical protein VIU93_14410 [Gallionellaceae bacterium]
MKVSSVTVDAIEHGAIAHHKSKSMTSQVSLGDLPVLKQLNHIGSAIALGEAGDLDAAHEFRNKCAGM